MSQYTIYLVDDEKSIRTGVQMVLSGRYRVEVFGTAEAGLEAIDHEIPDLVLLDIGLPEMDGLTALGEIKKIDPMIPVVMITAYEDVKTVITAMKGGAYDYVLKPLQMDSLEITVANGLETIRLRREVQRLQQRYLKDNMPCFIGESRSIQDVVEFVKKVAKGADTPILIQGHTGTGKELLARAVHGHSPHFAGPFVALNCSAIPDNLLESELFGYAKGAFSGAAPTGKKGLIEEAAHGTLFMDEIGDLALASQAKVLRFLENGEYYRVGSTKKRMAEVRIVSASNMDLEKMVAAGTFRRDLYYRLAVIKVELPCLAERRDDILPIAQYFLEMFSRKHGKACQQLSPEAVYGLQTHCWDGNIRQLRNVMERAVLVAEGQVVAVSDLGLSPLLSAEVIASPVEGERDVFDFAPLPADGAFFREMAARVTAHSLFLHENNGFVFGYLLAMFGFIKWGIYFVYWAPLISFSLSGLSLIGYLPLSLLTLLLASYFSLLQESLTMFWTLHAGILIGAALYYLTPRQRGKRSKQQKNKTKKPLPSLPIGVSLWEQKGLLLASGFNLILMQFFIVREFSSILSANELTILIVAVAYFLGYSVGYGLSKQLTLRHIRIMIVVAFFLHLLILIFTKLEAAYLISQGHGLLALCLLLVIVTLGTSVVYSVLLPTFIDLTGGTSLTTAYSWDLIGAALGGVAMFLLSLYAPQVLWPLYFFILMAMIFVLLKNNPYRPLILSSCLVTFAFFCYHQQTLFTYATEDYYKARGYSNPKVLYAKNSFYHAVEVVESYHDEAQTSPQQRFSLLNGIKYFDYQYQGKKLDKETGLSEFSYFLAELPAKYKYQQAGRKLRVLILGGGSMFSLARVAPYSQKTTLVEIDPAIVEAAKSHWSQFNQWQTLANYEIRLEDAKRYLRSTNETFDLIINDISAPYYLGTRLLHSKEFYEIIKTKLRKDGIFSESTQSRPNPKRPDSDGIKILKGVAETFPHYRLIDGKRSPRASHGYVYASTDFPFATQALVKLMKKDQYYQGTSTYSERSPRFKMRKTTPFDLSSMESLLRSNHQRLKNRLRLNKKPYTPAPLAFTDFQLVQAVNQQLTQPMFWANLLGFLLILGGIQGYASNKRWARQQAQLKS